MKRIKKHVISPAAASRVRRAKRDATEMMKHLAANPGINELMALHRSVQATESILASQTRVYNQSGSSSNSNTLIV